jgi:mono/diheme cytochrome c family protein
VGSFAWRWAKVRKVLIFKGKSLNFCPGTSVAPFSRENSGGCRIERKGETMKTFKTMMLATVAMALVAAFALISAAARVHNADEFDAAATYKAKCVACHGATAEKKFNATLSDADLVQAVLKGKKPEKPPNMPAYEEKGINEDQAKALVAYMKSLKQ